MKQQEKEKEYETYVKEKTPVRKPGPAMAKAFVTGGIICTIGQTILNACEKAGMSKDISASWCSLILILASVVLTGFGIYPKIANWCRSPDLSIPLRRRQLNTKKRGRFSELAARYLRSQDL